MLGFVEGRLCSSRMCTLSSVPKMEQLNAKRGDQKSLVSHYSKPRCCFRSYCFAHFPKFGETSWLLKPWHRLTVLPAHGTYSLTLWSGGGELGMSSWADFHIPMLPSSDNIWGYRTLGCISILSNLIPGKKILENSDVCFVWQKFLDPFWVERSNSVRIKSLYYLKECGSDSVLLVSSFWANIVFGNLPNFIYKMLMQHTHF